MGARRWTDEETAFLRESASSLTVAQLSQRLGRSAKAVRHRLEAQGLTAADGRSTPEARERVAAARARIEFTETEQRCAKCGAWKLLDDFSPGATTLTGRNSWCKQCVREYAQWRRENEPGYREQERAASQRWRDRRRHA